MKRNSNRHNFQTFHEAVHVANEMYGFQQIQDSSVALYRHANVAPAENGESQTYNYSERT